MKGRIPRGAGSFQDRGVGKCRSPQSHQPTPPKPHMKRTSSPSDHSPMPVLVPRRIPDSLFSPELTATVDWVCAQCCGTWSPRVLHPPGVDSRVRRRPAKSVSTKVEMMALQSRNLKRRTRRGNTTRYLTSRVSLSTRCKFGRLKSRLSALVGTNARSGRSRAN